jgi:hypothetical protein
MERTFHCDICDKQYSSNFSLSNHIRIYHADKNIDNTKRNKNNEDNNYHCRYCENKYKSSKSRWNHEQKCKTIQVNNSNDDKDKDEIILKQAEEIIKLQSKIIKSNRKEIKSFKALNQMLKDRSYNNSHNNNSFNTINNNIQQICNVGNEELASVLTMQQKKQIINSKYKAFDKLIEIAHCGDYDQFKNIVITNLKDNFIYKYDKDKGYFITVEKNYFFDNFMDLRLFDLETIYDELTHANKIDNKTKQIIQTFLDDCNSKESYTDQYNIRYPNFRAYKTNTIKIFLYNNHDKITKDIALLICNHPPYHPNDNPLDNHVIPIHS